MERTGEKWGWIGGWGGGFIWVVIVSLIILLEGKLTQGMIGLGLTGAAAVVILVCAPWRWTDTPYWKLMLPVYALFLASIAWAVWSYDGLEALGLNKWSAFILVPIFLPLAIAGRRTWNGASDRARG